MGQTARTGEGVGRHVDADVQLVARARVCHRPLVAWRQRRLLRGTALVCARDVWSQPLDTVQTRAVPGRRGTIYLTRSAPLPLQRPHRRPEPLLIYEFFMTGSLATADENGPRPWHTLPRQRAGPWSMLAGATRARYEFDPGALRGHRLLRPLGQHAKQRLASPRTTRTLPWL